MQKLKVDRAEILLIDNCPTSLDTIKKQLEGMQLEVDTASNMSEGMKMVKKRMRGQQQGTSQKSISAESSYKLILIEAGASPDFEGLKIATNIRKYHTTNSSMQANTNEQSTFIACYFDSKVNEKAAFMQKQQLGPSNIN